MQQKRGSFSVFTMLALAIMGLFFIQAAGIVFIQLGIPVWLAVLIVPGSLIGSVINIPLYTIKSKSEECTPEPYIYYWGVSYQVFEPDCPGETQISINVGGAIIPILVSGYLLIMNYVEMLQIVIAVVVVTLVVHRVARIEPNVGILTPGFLPALVAVFATIAVALVFPWSYNLYAIAYIAGTLGTLIGADILNLNKLSQLKTGNASIGGAGTWDGVFLTGILAVFLL
jgi:uncharacterized membrane protein